MVLTTSLAVGRGIWGLMDSAVVLGENSQLLMVLTTSLAVLVSCVLFCVWRRGGSAPWNPPEKMKEDEEDDSRKNKVTVFFGTQTGTTEGFANVRSGFVSSFLANEKWRLFQLRRPPKMAFVGTTQKCKACEKTVYLVDQLTADNSIYHKSRWIMKMSMIRFP